MKKLLHERLRDKSMSSCSSCCLNEMFSHCLSHKTCSECNHEVLNKFADEIERDYIPRPRDNKGIPFTEGDIVYSIDPDTEYSGEVIMVGSYTLYVLLGDGKYDVVDTCDVQHFRPQPKILDADGVEIKVGDKPFSIKLKHQKPEVISVHKAGDINPYCDKVIKKDFVCYEGGWDYAESLTHKEPDSLEKLYEDMNKSNLGYIGEDEICEWLDRLSAIIEMGE